MCLRPLNSVVGVYSQILFKSFSVPDLFGNRRRTSGNVSAIEFAL